ncbi:MAG: hypothetical protein RL134_2631 [Actinomycetota bacterium]|jgi:hypothetical protein
MPGTVSPNIKSDRETWLVDVAATPRGANAGNDVEVHMKRCALDHVPAPSVGTSAMLIRRRAIDHMRTDGALCWASRMCSR